MSKKRSARLEDDGKLLVITIDGEETVYRVDRLDPDPAVANPAFNLTKMIVVTAAEDMSAAALESDAKEELIPTDDIYHVSIQTGWPVCTCQAFEYSKRDPKTCKHCEALLALQLLNFPP